jgi:hypothetical protein
MTKDEFLALSIDDRGTIVWNNGEMLDTVVYNGFQVQLWSVNSFFVEVVYDPITVAIEKIQIADDELLKKFISDIDVKF